jgi:hypothetical protein
MVMVLVLWLVAITIVVASTLLAAVGSTASGYSMIHDT